jgi:hypothetical protein
MFVVFFSLTVITCGMLNFQTIKSMEPDKYIMLCHENVKLYLINKQKLPITSIGFVYDLMRVFQLHFFSHAYKLLILILVLIRHMVLNSKDIYNIIFTIIFQILLFFNHIRI